VMAWRHGHQWPLQNCRSAPSGPKMRDTTPRLPEPSMSWPLFLAAAGAGLTVLIVLLNPEPSRALGPGVRMLFWALHVGLPLLLLQLMQVALSRWPVVWRLGVWAQVGLAGVAGAALFAPVAVLLDILFGLAAVTDDRTEPWAARIGDEFLALAPLVVLVWLALNAARGLRLPTLRNDVGEPPQAIAPPETVPAFLSRVPASLGRDLIALHAELHYLRVETRLGNTLILYPFGQAVAELAPLQIGLQVHRSHWVAIAHVRGIRRDGAGLSCILDTGAVLPVGRSRKAEVAARLPFVQ
jgi:hypothetical protein